ncbi:hypothetical protein GQ44DRAFT_739784 [Phaeosphaeriaceae sp. PMI808]|nr:hypothetical protein GQ44DRAFT_739784 [Phaeosphaeriaceae sp. PMI808]
MLEHGAMLRLKRTHSDVDHLIPPADTTPPTSPGRQTATPRATRSFSWSKLTESIKGKAPPSRSSRGSSIEKKRPGISYPIPLRYNPPLPPTPTTLPSPLLPGRFVAQSSPSLRQSGSNLSCKDYDCECRGTTTRSVSPDFPPPPRRVPPPIPQGPNFGSLRGLFDRALEKISESYFENEDPVESLQLDALHRWFRDMEPTRLEPARLQPPAGGTKTRAMQEAKQMEELVAERAKRSGDKDIPPYEFYELIGKGAYGRVYKGKSRIHGGLVAIKIIDIDNQDYQEMTTENLAQTIKEIDILQQLRDSKARPYVNIIEEARTVHNELWIVSEYASGGSDPGPGLPEKFIIPIARELAYGLKDLKTNNVLVLEDGRVQLCDFGSKRTTIVGTPAWMAPELQQEWPKEIQYGNEVDIWAGFPPHHKINQLDLPNAGAPELEGDRFSQEIKDFLAFIFQPDPKDRPTPDQILEHPYIAGSTKLYPTFTLVKLGGARASLFNPYGAQAPDPLSSEEEDDDDDWSFSTTEEFEQEHASQFGDPFAAPGQGFAGINIPPIEDMGRFEQLQARFKEESIVRGQQRLNKLFDKSTTPYRYSMVDGEDKPSGRPQSDLVLRDFNPGAPQRETVIDLDFSMPSVEEPSIDLGESILREMAEEEEHLTKRATRDWKFPGTNGSSDKPEQPNRKTMEWSFPSEPQPKRETMEWSFAAAQPQKPNRRTVEWTFDAAMAERDYDAPRNRTSRRRETREWKSSKPDDNRKTQDFAFPMRSPSRASGPPSPPTLVTSLHSATTSAGEPDDFPRISNSPESPLRGSSMIDLDMATIQDYRPSTSGSDAIHTARTVNENPFNLEDQVQLSQNNHRASYHFQSKSEPNQTVPGLLTPTPKTTTPSNPQTKCTPARSQTTTWDTWSHTHAYGLGSDDQSPPTSVTTDTSLSDDDIDLLWDTFERLHIPGNEADASTTYYYSSSDSSTTATTTRADQAFRKSRVSAGPAGQPLLDFAMPRDWGRMYLLKGVAELLLRGAVELRDGARAGRDLLRAMRLEEVGGDMKKMEGIGVGQHGISEDMCKEAQQTTYIT